MQDTEEGFQNHKMPTDNCLTRTVLVSLLSPHEGWHLPAWLLRARQQGSIPGVRIVNPSPFFLEEQMQKFQHLSVWFPLAMTTFCNDGCNATARPESLFNGE